MGILNGILSFTNWMWSLPMLIVLIGGGIWITIACDFVQIKHIGASLKHAWKTAFHGEKEAGKANGFQAVTAALANTIGTGNIVGVGAAIATGGPGAVFWMWVIGFVAMALKYSEAVMAIDTREKDENGKWKGGAPVYLAKVWKPLGVAWGVFMLYGAAIGCGAHTGSVGVGMAEFGVPAVVTTVVLAALVLLIAIRGFSQLVQITDKLVPFMAILYLFAGLLVIVLNIGNIGHAFASIFVGAFTGTAATGGFVGATLSAAIRNGSARGVYSSDAGNGSASMMHAQAETDEPVEQGMMGVFEVFVDTIVICTFTALIILCSGVWETGDAGSVLAMNGLASTLGGFGRIVGAVSLILFPLSSILSLTSAVCLIAEDLFNKYVKYAVIVFVTAIVVAGGTIGVDAFLTWVDTANMLGILLNVGGMVFLTKRLRELTLEYFNRKKKTA